VAVCTGLGLVFASSTVQVFIVIVVASDAFDLSGMLLVIELYKRSLVSSQLLVIQNHHIVLTKSYRYRQNQ